MRQGQAVRRSRDRNRRAGGVSRSGGRRCDGPEETEKTFYTTYIYCKIDVSRTTSMTWASAMPKVTLSASEELREGLIRES